MFLWSFSVQQTTYRIGNHVYYWVRLRPDPDCCAAFLLSYRFWRVLCAGFLVSYRAGFLVLFRRSVLKCFPNRNIYAV